MRAFTHGCWAHRQRVSTTILTRKNSQICLVLRTGFEPSTFGFESYTLPIEPPRHPYIILYSPVWNLIWFHCFLSARSLNCCSALVLLNWQPAVVDCPCPPPPLCRIEDNCFVVLLFVVGFLVVVFIGVCVILFMFLHVCACFLVCVGGFFFGGQHVLSGYSGL